MKAPAPKKENIEEGNYIATIYRIIYMGEVEGEYKGVKNSAFKINVTWELPTEMKVWKEGEEAKPVVISKMFTLSMGKKANLRKIVEGIVGGMTDSEAIDFDVDELLGKSCLLNITYGVSELGNEKQNIATSKLMKGVEAPKPFNKQQILSYQNWNEELFQSLPEFIRKEMESTIEYQTMKGIYVFTPEPKGTQIDEAPVPSYGTGEAPNPDDIPF